MAIYEGYLIIAIKAFAPRKLATITYRMQITLEAITIGGYIYHQDTAFKRKWLSQVIRVIYLHFSAMDEERAVDFEAISKMTIQNSW